jgi:membrane protease YdiL (CAAX protease family)
VSGEVLSGWSFDHVASSATLFIAAFYVPLFSGVLITCVLISRRFGTGCLSADFGWRFQLGDLWRGGIVLVLSLIAAGIAVLPWLHDNDASRTADQFQRAIGSFPAAAVALFALAAVVAAPLLEELAFRGLLQRSLTKQFGLGPAIGLQAILFGAYHFTPGLGRYNYAHIATTTAFGVIAGISAARWKRLGPSIIAHAVINSFTVVAIATSR